MRFRIGGDTGDKIYGWVVPDNPLVLSSVIIRSRGREIAKITTSIYDENFVKFGWHSTGYCNFEINKSNVPGLEEIRDLELFDADTNVLIYRRIEHSSYIDQRLILINTSIEPETDLQSALFTHFRQSYFGLDRMSEEIITSIFSSLELTSLFLSGSINVPRYENFMMPDTCLTAALIHDPFVEMARRMIWLQSKSEAAGDSTQAWRVGSYKDSALLLRDCELSNVGDLKKFFRYLPEPAYNLLYNPLIRQFGTRLPEDRVFPGHSIAAIEVLARVAIVGHFEHFELFAAVICEKLGLNLPTINKKMPSDKIMSVSMALRSLKFAREMVAFDVAIADVVLETVRKT